MASSVRLAGAFQVTTGRPGRARRDVQRDEAPQAGAEQPEPAVEPRVTGEQREHGLDVLDARGDRRLLLDPARLAAAAEVEARQRKAGRGQPSPSMQVLVAVLGGAEAVTGHHARDARARSRKMEDEGEAPAGDGDGGARSAVTAQTRSKSRQVFAESSEHRVVDGQPLDLGDLLGHPAASHGPEDSAGELALVLPGRVALDQQRLERTCSTSSRSRSR